MRQNVRPFEGSSRFVEPFAMAAKRSWRAGLEVANGGGQQIRLDARSPVERMLRVTAATWTIVLVVFITFHD